VLIDHPSLFYIYKYSRERSSTLLVACNAGVFFGRANAIAAILDFKIRGRLGRVERATNRKGVSLKGKGGGQGRGGAFTNWYN